MKSKLKTGLMVCCLLPLTLYADQLPTLEKGFANPPTSAHPYVWWHWMGSNFSKEGITKDLEAMKAEGIGGATIFNISSAVQESHKPTENNPWPKQTYRSNAYWEALKWAAQEADRLGLELGLHNTAGYSTTGGPWIDERKSMKHIVMSRTTTSGGTNELQLARPELKPYNGWGNTNQVPTIYSDIAVLACPQSSTKPINTTDILDLTSHLDARGILNYTFPSGKWTVYRIGYASTMANPHPLPDELIGHSLEADKITATHTRFHWDNVLDPLVQHLKEYIGHSFKHILIDSYEAGEQNWSENFRQEFIKRKGYDPIPWLITTQQTVNDNEQTKRFGWDYRDVIADLYYTNGWEIASEMIHNHGMILFQEPYYGPFSTVDGAALADIPMGEFWTGGNGAIQPEVAAAARAAGRTIVGAEAFTSSPALSAWTEDPAMLKPLAEGAFASGVNRLILHHWVHQPFDDRYQPGMGMGWWGTHFNRNQTWFEPAKAFFTYLGRAQYMLQQGEQVVDYLCLEQPIGELSDVISTRHLLHDKIKVKDGQIVLPSGRHYAFLVLPDSHTMLPEVLKKISQLLKSGALIVAPERPTASPSLKGYPICDQQVEQLSAKLWNTYHKQILTSVDEAKLRCNLTPDCIIDRPKIHYIHRQSGTTDIYYLTNLGDTTQTFTASLRITDKLPELWNAEDGTVSIAPYWEEHNGRTEITLKLYPAQSIFIVLRHQPTLQQISEGRQNKQQTELLSTTNLDRNWSVSFVPKLGAPFKRNFDRLADWGQQSDGQIAYFAGTAIYHKTIHLDNTSFDNRIWTLDLGELHDIAQLRINGQDAGVLFYPPYIKDITPWLKPGDNELEIMVANNWANALIGDEQIPADFEWGEDRGTNGRMLKKYPEWFLKGQARPSDRKYFTIWYYHRADSPLQKAGLIGPVKLKESIINP